MFIGVLQISWVNLGLFSSAPGLGPAMRLDSHLVAAALHLVLAWRHQFVLQRKHAQRRIARAVRRWFHRRWLSLLVPPPCYQCDRRVALRGQTRPWQMTCYLCNASLLIRNRTSQGFLAEDRQRAAEILEWAENALFRLAVPSRRSPG